MQGLIILGSMSIMTLIAIVIFLKFDEQRDRKALDRLQKSKN